MFSNTHFYSFKFPTVFFPYHTAPTQQNTGKADLRASEIGCNLAGSFCIKEKPFLKTVTQVEDIEVSLNSICLSTWSLLTNLIPKLAIQGLSSITSASLPDHYSLNYQFNIKDKWYH